MIEETSVKTRFTKYPWGQCSLNKMCVVNTRCLVRGGASYNGQYGYGEAPLERGTFFSLQVYEWVEVSLVEV